MISSHATALLAADVKMRQLKEELDKVTSNHASEKTAWAVKKRAMKAREHRAKAAAEAARSQLAAAAIPLFVSSNNNNNVEPPAMIDDENYSAAQSRDDCEGERTKKLTTSQRMRCFAFG